MVNGPRINLLTDAADRDPIAGTPHHKDVWVRLEPATDQERASCEHDSERVRLLISGAIADPGRRQPRPAGADAAG